MGAVPGGGTRIRYLYFTLLHTEWCTTDYQVVARACTVTSSPMLLVQWLPGPPWVLAVTARSADHVVPPWYD